MKYETIDAQSIAKLMHNFYEKIRYDENLGPIFNKAIGESNEEWQEHKEKIGNFWQGMLLGEGNYNGQPLKAHMDLAPFPQEFFDIWLNLFEKSLNELYNEEMSEVILTRAKMIARNFKNVLYGR
ncbi:group III truncated hemoglobin [Campylobacter sp. US33a]|uniref:Group III truncated hemoglobin n=1 Tax=Campylobacter sp. CCS1377 TaxID=3158229 RepID=A0AAU7E5P3_9BACT|nr:group III truncated hemoglobin [Campylobacter sp. US33a]MCW1360947.1 group III truncated hemoglobin [Campylobacter jejuni]TEY01610.1 group III truncated hemoglobin [Campylobacter sp. US33a]